MRRAQCGIGKCRQAHGEIKSSGRVQLRKILLLQHKIAQETKATLHVAPPRQCRKRQLQSNMNVSQILRPSRVTLYTRRNFTTCCACQEEGESHRQHLPFVSFCHGWTQQSSRKPCSTTRLKCCACKEKSTSTCPKRCPWGIMKKICQNRYS